VRRNGRTAERRDLLHDRRGDRRIGAFSVHRAAEIVDHDLGAATSQLERKEASQPTSGPSYDHHLSGKIDRHHLLHAVASRSDPFRRPARARFLAMTMARIE
jgi:hypothetical protein